MEGKYFSKNIDFLFKLGEEFSKGYFILLKCNFKQISLIDHGKVRNGTRFLVHMRWTNILQLIVEICPLKQN